MTADKPIIPPIERACAHCIWAAAVGKKEAECRRYPPTVQLLVTKAPQVLLAAMKDAGHAAPQDTLNFPTVFPRVDPNTWCGEYLPHPEHQPEATKPPAANTH